MRKRYGVHKTTRDDLAWEIQEEVEAGSDVRRSLQHTMAAGA